MSEIISLNEYQRLAMTTGDKLVFERKKMRLSEYQVGAKETAVYDVKMLYPALGLAGETFEFIEKCFQVPFNDEEVSKEVGDILWYLANVAEDCGLTLEECAGVENFSDLRGRPEVEDLSAGICIAVRPIVENIKKCSRDDDGVLTEDRREVIKQGIHETINVLAEISIELKTTLARVAQANYDKLKSRQARGKLQGSGDNR